MEKHSTIAEKLQKKYHKTEEITNFKQMLYRSADIYRSRTAFKKKDSNGNIISITYEELKNDVIYLGTSLINKGFLNKRIAVIGKNSYDWCVSYLAASIVGVVVPIDKELHTDDVINFMNVSEAVCILGDSKNLNKVLDCKNRLKYKETFFIHFDENKDECSLSFIKQEGKKLYDME